MVSGRVHHVVMVTDGPGAGTIWQLDSPACRVIRDTGTGRIESVAVWWPQHGYSVVRPEGAQLDRIRRGFAAQVADGIVAAVWPAGSSGIGGAGASALAEDAALLSIVRDLADPRIFVSQVVGVMAQIAAFNVCFGLPAARVIGQLAGELAGRLLGAEPDGPGMRALQYADVTFSAAGKLAEYSQVAYAAVESPAEVAPRLRDLDREPSGGRERAAGTARRRADVVGEQQTGRAAWVLLPGVGQAGGIARPGARPAGPRCPA